MNLSKIKRDKMLNTINEIKKNISDEETLNNLSLIENEIRDKKYGLIWEEHEERVDKELETKIPTFDEVKDKEIVSKANENFNFLLEGDNLHSLYLLKKTHKEKIDAIYIDPPYNTGSRDFVYNDINVDITDEYKHSKWISFMKKRLLIAKELLKDTGVIFISIDDHELYQLKLLCDDIFDESNFISTLTIESGEVFGTKASHVNKTFVKVKDYVLIYSKSEKWNEHIKIPLVDESRDLFDSHYNIIIDDNLNRTNLVDYLKKDEFSLERFNKFNLALRKENINLLMLLDSNFKEYIFNSLSKKMYADAPFSAKIPNELSNNIKNGQPFIYKNKLLYKTSTGTIRMFISFYDCLKQSDDYNSNFTRCTYRGDLWKNFHFDMRNIDDEGNEKFKSGKKPVRLIYQLLKWANIASDGIVLDFFAGSGTTAEAVLKLNKEIDGNRNFILCTNNENNICEEITYKRIKNVIDGYGRNEALKTNLKYYRCTYIPRINTEKENLHNNLLINIKNLIQLENGIEIDDNKIRVYLNEEELDEFSNNKEKLKVCDKVYISSDILLTSEQEDIFNSNNIELYIIPEYYFEDEIMEVM